MSRPTRYSEIFNSVQGEGHYTGVPTVWLRYFLCNLQCNGFGQDEPTNPDSWDLPYERIDIKDITRVEDLPVFEKGCDSSYTWAKKFRHLMQEGTPKEIKERLQDAMRTDSNPEGLFLHPVSKQRMHLCFTGGEPLMKHGQLSSIGVITEFLKDRNVPASVTYETNGTQELTEEFMDAWDEFIAEWGVELFFSVSPKLWTVAGEKVSRAIKPEVVAKYHHMSRNGQLKFVVGADQDQWDDMEQQLAKFREAGVDYPVWVMPTGAREEEQIATAGDVAKKAYERGYNVSARVHTYLFGNAIGT